MPYSDRSHDEVALEEISRLDPDVVVDVGAGAGKWGDLLAGRAAVAAIEVWEPYVSEFGLEGKYDRVFVGDVRDGFEIDGVDLLNISAWWEVDPGTTTTRLFIFGDVLEHMTVEDALRVYTEVVESGSEVLITIPVVQWPQGHEHGNPYEEHIVDDWTIEKVLDTFEGVRLVAGDGEGDVTAVFVTW